jgi:hypothetical protein
MPQTSYEVVDGGRPVGWVVAAETAPQAGPGGATVLLIRTAITKSAA